MNDFGEMLKDWDVAQGIIDYILVTTWITIRNPGKFQRILIIGLSAIRSDGTPYIVTIWKVVFANKFRV